MGMIQISTSGSFGWRNKDFSAIDYGHAHAVAQVIAYLSVEVLPAAIAQDHALHDDHYFPEKGFSKDD